VRITDTIWHNGSLLTLAEARLNPASAGALFGRGVFTTLAVREGRARGLALHWQRLIAAAERLAIPLRFADTDVAAGLRMLAERNGVVDGKARVTLLAGPSQPWPVEGAETSDLFVFAEAAAPGTPLPRTLTVSPYRISSGSPLAGIKTSCHLPTLLALDEARAREFDDAILLNERGEVVETTSANVFWLEGNRLYTPSLATGCLPGIARRLLVEAAGDLKIALEQGNFQMGALRRAREVMLTNSLWGVIGVSQVDLHRYEAPGPVTRLLSGRVEQLWD
jgi:branched-subunit amino acid aminotransferase/4-amino-4-deoxychorismate lyase